jgi:hypothetical protein
MDYNISARHLVGRTPSDILPIPERTYFAGLKKPVLDINNSKPSTKSITGDIIDFIKSNPVVSLGGVGLLGAGLFMLTGKKKPARLPEPDIAKQMNNMVQSSITGMTTLIATAAIVKKLNQDSPEVFALRRELELQQKQKAKPLLSFKKKPTAVKSCTCHIPDVYDKNMAKIFNT